MAFLKYLLPYSVCALALVLLQNSFVLSEEASQCISCDSKNNGNDSMPFKCSNTAVNVTTAANLTTCLSSSCGTYTWKVNETVYTVRGCDVDCTTLESKLGSNSGWNCTSCVNDKNGTLCNSNKITNSGSQGLVAMVPMILSAVLAIYLTI